MADAGAFRRLDAVLGWHPSGETSVVLAGGLAMDSLSFRFKGRTAHAAGAPHKGRSALDGAMLTDIAVNYLREHVESNTRIHSVIPDGGSAPNVVPDTAEIWYYVRGRDREQVDELTRRVTRCAKGAGMATETTVRTTFHDSVTERIPNETLAKAMDAILHRCGPPRFTLSDARAADRITPGKKLPTKIEEIKTKQGKGSSDEDNVSWFAPLVRINVACVPDGTIGHHREYAAMIRTPGAHKGTIKAAEYLAAGAVELALNKPLLARAQAEHKKNMRGKKYKLPKRTSRTYG
jgi:aminobenzoyl-glutamate utilization protein B